MVDLQHLAILEQGREKWNQWRKENPYIRPDLRKAILKSRNFCLVNFDNCDLGETCFDGSDLAGATFYSAWVESSSFRDAHIHTTTFIDSKLAFSNFEGSSADFTNFVNCNLHQTNFRGVNLERSSLSRSWLRLSDFRHANLDYANLSKADMREANFSDASLNHVNIDQADLVEANFHRAKLVFVHGERAFFGSTNFDGADLTDAFFLGSIFDRTSCRNTLFINTNLVECSFLGADLAGAILEGVSLEAATLVGVNLEQAKISNCGIHGISVWGVNLTNANQSNLRITHRGESAILVDNLEVAQFIYLLINNNNLRTIIDTVGEKAVLILGRFTDERKAVLEAVAEGLRKTEKYIPIIFDWMPPTTLDLTETVATLAHLSRFVIADLSDPNSIPHELMSFVEKLISVPVQPIFCPVPSHPNPYPMFKHILRYSHVLPLFPYETKEELIAQLPEKIIEPLEAKVKEVRASI